MNIHRSTSGQLFLDDKPVLTKKVIDNKNKYVGIVVALKLAGEIRFGFSKINSQLDRWDAERGLKVAIGRALTHGDISLPFKQYMILSEDGSGEVVKQIPYVVRPYLTNLYYRAKNYFKD